MGYCLYRPQPFEAGPGAESVRSVADSCWSRIKGRDKVELKLGCGNYDPQTPPSTLDSISLKDYPDRLLERISKFFKWLAQTAEQLTVPEKWTMILSQALKKYLRGRNLQAPPSLFPVRAHVR